MNKDINKTLMALVPILKMNGENVTNIEAVHDWYKVGDREYMKEVAEITYDNDTVRYADIGCDSNLAAIYDVMAVIQRIKPESEAIERIERGVYSLPPAQPEQRWIPVTERLPDKNGKYLCSIQSNFKRKKIMRISTTDFESGINRWSPDCMAFKDRVIAWMPLPEPYSKKNEPFDGR